MSEPSGQVVTFYSFKGGTGRTMALANVAWILAANGKKVLVADWDLESPGLHRFFRPFLSPEAIKGTGGVIDMIRAYEWQATAAGAPQPEGWHEKYARVSQYAFPVNWRFPSGGRLDFLSAGRQNGDYALSLTSLDWEAFYRNLSGEKFFGALRRDMKANYDYTLIDSRTGLSDVADICTIHLPDCLVDCFTFSEQGIEGAAAVAADVKDQFVDGRKIRILPVPMRVDGAEKEKADIGRAVAMRRFEGLPAGLSETDHADYWKTMAVPYQAFYAYEETLATFGDVPGQTGTLLSAFERLTSKVTNGAVTSLPPMEEAVRLREVDKFKRRLEADDAEIFVESAEEDELWAEWVESLLIAAEVRVSKERAEGPGKRRLVVLSNPDTAAGFGLNQPAIAPAGTAEPFVVYVSDMAALPHVPKERVARIAGLDEAAAAERILLLAGRSMPPKPLQTAARFPGLGPDIFNAPARNPRFTGRDEPLRQLRRLLQPQDGSPGIATVALLGLGGIGKSQLAQEYVYRYRNAYDIIWWIAADPPQFLDAHLSDLAQRMGLNTSPNSGENAKIVLAALGRDNPSLRWLLVYDNADDVEHVSSMLPKGRGHTLLTSRNNAWAGRASAFDVSVFNRDESVSYLRRRLSYIAPLEADHVAEALGDLPLAIDLAESLLVESGMPLAEYLRLIEQGSAGAESENVWDPSLERLKNQSPGAFRLLQLCSVIAAEASLDLIHSDEMAEAVQRYDPAAADRQQRATLVRHLTRLSLAKVDAQRGQIQIHRLLQRAVRNKMTRDEVEDARHQMHLVLAASRPRNEVEDSSTWARFRLLWPHLGISQAASCNDEKVRQLLIDRVRYLWLRGDYTQGEELAKPIVEAWGALLDGADDFVGDKEAIRRQQLLLKFNLANILRSTARFAEAKKLDDEVFEAQMVLLGPDHVHTLMTKGSLAADLRSLGRYEEALAMDKETYPAWQDILGEDNHRTLIAGSNLATAHRLMGEFESARKLDEYVYSRRQIVLAPRHPWTLASGTSLGRDYRDAGQYERSVSLLKYVYDEIVAARGADGVEAFAAYANYAVSLRAAGRARDAMPILDTVHDSLKRTVGESNPETLACRLSRAVNLLAINQNERADEEMRSVIGAYTDRFGPAHPHTLICKSNRSAILRALDDLSSASELAGQAADALTESLTPAHPFAIGARMNQAVCLADMNELDVAEEITREAESRMVPSLGAAHPDTLRCQANLALIRRAKNEPAAAASVERAIDRLAEAITPDHPSVRALREGKYAHRIIEPHPF